jgi:hypothetical protein
LALVSQAERQADRQTVRQTDRQTGRHRQADRQVWAAKLQTIFRKERGRKGGRRSKLKFVIQTVR